MEIVPYFVWKRLYTRSDLHTFRLPVENAAKERFGSCSSPQDFLHLVFPDSSSNGDGPQGAAAAAMAPSDVVSLVQRSLQPEMSRRMEARQRMDDAAVRSAILANGGGSESGDERASNGDQP